MVGLTVITPEGGRFPLLGRVGQRLSDALAASPYEAVSSAAPSLSPRHGHEAHVRVGGEEAERVPPRSDDEAARLPQLADDVRPDSRLASFVVLDGGMNALVVALAPLHPHHTI